METTVEKIDRKTTAKKTKRRGRGEGGIHRRDNGRWEATISLGVDPVTLKRKRQVVYGLSKKEVQDKLAELNSKRINNTLVEPSRLTVGTYLTQWLESRKSTVRLTTYSAEKASINKHIIPHIGNVLLNKLTSDHVEALLNAMEKGGASSVVRRAAYAVLTNAMSRAVTKRKLSVNPCNRKQVMVPATRPEIHPLDQEQVGILLEATKDDRLAALYVVAVTCGLRLGECFGLQWSDIDFKNKTLSIRHTLEEVNGKFTLREPKTNASRRRIDLSPMTIDALNQHRQKMMIEGHAACPFVFVAPRGGWIHRADFHKRVYKPLLERAGLPDISFHCLRHGMASLMLSAGIHPKIVSARLGHSSVAITMDVYSHMLPGMGSDAATKLDSIINAKPKELGAAIAAG